MPKSKKLKVEDFDIALYAKGNDDFFSLTDMARYRDVNRTNYIIQNWMRTRNAIEFNGLWEQLNNPEFKRIEFNAFKNEAGANSFTLTPQKWIESTNAIGIVSKSGRYGGTFAHKDIAFEFATWLSPAFKLYLIKEFQRLKDEENSSKKLDWDLHRTLSKINYRIHTDAIKETLIPPTITKEQMVALYANEADILNVALFGKTAKQWREQNTGEPGNIRDHATLEQLVVLANLESNNALLIRNGLSQADRLRLLNESAIQQMKSMLGNPSIKRLRY
jgi:KilA-N domain